MDMRVYEDLADLIRGSWPTPLYRLKSFGEKNVWGKLEFMNPITHSIKDRTALSLFQEAMKATKAGDPIIEASSGNMAVALAALSAAYGRRMIAYVSTRTAAAHKAMLKLLGSEVRERDGGTPDMIDEVREEARRLHAHHPNQFENPRNYLIHYEETARELDEQLLSAGLRVGYIVAGLGTAGHITGLSLYFKEKYGSSMKVIGVEPLDGIPGIKEFDGNPFREVAKIDEVVKVSLREALAAVKLVAANDGLLLGPSSGAVVAAIRRLELDGAVGIFPDDAWKYADLLARSW
ncbi:cysteine synthase [Thermocladium modestius]|uniref:Cysteine synthase n=2 Tax=Thermocladium modestius TaxID=62609 RepID=A0A830GUI9_9CREN|nr:cysteine synthase [Thermocladium modestius]